MDQALPLDLLCCIPIHELELAARLRRHILELDQDIIADIYGIDLQRIDLRGIRRRDHLTQCLPVVADEKPDAINPCGNVGTMMTGGAFLRCLLDESDICCDKVALVASLRMGIVEIGLDLLDGFDQVLPEILDLVKVDLVAERFIGVRDVQGRERTSKGGEQEHHEQRENDLTLHSVVTSVAHPLNSQMRSL